MQGHAHQTGTCYLLCWAATPYKHAGHYLGWAADLDVRLAAHRAGNGARLIAVIMAAGIEWQLARTWPGTTEGHEKTLKDRNNRRALCPLCNPGTKAGTVIVPKQYRRKTNRT
jgi:predicted GIY-YIG superfamily endonuclease